MTPFDYINSINYTKKDLMTDTENDELAEAGYVPFVVNRTLSYFPDTILYANEMNVNHHIDKKLQFHYLLNSIRPRKRYSKWFKPEKEENITAIMEYYKCNRKRAEECNAVLTDDNIKNIKEALCRGDN